MINGEQGMQGNATCLPFVVYSPLFLFSSGFLLIFVPDIRNL